jgi:hypothetical protein
MLYKASQEDCFLDVAIFVDTLNSNYTKSMILCIVNVKKKLAVV